MSMCVTWSNLNTLGFFSSWVANRFCGGMMGTKMFGILGAITLFPLKVCFGNWYKQQYFIPEIFWITWLPCGQLKIQNSQKFLLQKYIVCNLKKCDILQRYCVNYTKLKNLSYLNSQISFLWCHNWWCQKMAFLLMHSTNPKKMNKLKLN